jgi:hypothetical protein
MRWIAVTWSRKCAFTKNVVRTVERCAFGVRYREIIVRRTKGKDNRMRGRVPRYNESSRLLTSVIFDYLVSQSREFLNYAPTFCIPTAPTYFKLSIAPLVYGTRIDVSMDQAKPKFVQDLGHCASRFCKWCYSAFPSQSYLSPEVGRQQPRLPDPDYDHVL